MATIAFKRRSVWGSALALGLAAVLAAVCCLGLHEEPVAGFGMQHSAPAPQSLVTAHLPAPSGNAGPKCTRFGSPISEDPGGAALRMRAKVSRTIQANFRDPMNLLANANGGDEASAIALFSLAANCPPYAGVLELYDLAGPVKRTVAREVCRALPDSVRNNPLAVLAPAAANGASHAQMVYAANAPRVLIVREFYGQVQATEVRPLLDTAERFGVQAAKAGNDQAYALMSRAYFDGSFGTPDPATAYAYALALARARPSSENRERSAFLQAQLTHEAAAAAEQLVNVCSPDGDQSRQVYLNPFGQ